MYTVLYKNQNELYLQTDDEFNCSETCSESVLPESEKETVDDVVNISCI